jgi:hypothetical protein
MNAEARESASVSPDTMRTARMSTFSVHPL